MSIVTPLDVWNSLVSSQSRPPRDHVLDPAVLQHSAEDDAEFERRDSDIELDDEEPAELGQVYHDGVQELGKAIDAESQRHWKAAWLLRRLRMGGLLRELQNQKPQKGRPKCKDVLRVESDPRRRYAQHVFVPGVFNLRVTTHHVIEVKTSSDVHYVVEWTVGADASDDSMGVDILFDENKWRDFCKRGKVQTRPWAEFAQEWGDYSTKNGRPVRFYTRTYDDGEFAYEEVIARLCVILRREEDNLADRSLDGVEWVYIPEYNKRFSYSLSNNNCEHLSNLIMSGVCVSKQIDWIMRLFRVTGLSRPKSTTDTEFGRPPKNRTRDPTPDEIREAAEFLREPASSDTTVHYGR